MPQLKSGRHVVLNATPLVDRFRYGSEHSISAAIMVFSLNVTGPEDLLDFIPVGYFREEEGEPPNAPTYGSGFNVQQVLEGAAGWSGEEIEEFGTWLKTNPQLRTWLVEHYEMIEKAIQDSVLLDPAFWSDDEPEVPDQ